MNIFACIFCKREESKIVGDTMVYNIVLSKTGFIVHRFNACVPCRMVRIRIPLATEPTVQMVGTKLYLTITFP